MTARIALALVAMGLLAQSAAGTQHLVRAGDDWERIVPACKPGDEIVLLPGDHRPVELRNLRGEPGKPITIRSVAPHAPAVIVAEQEGIRLVQPRFVVIENVRIRGATLCGLNVEGRGEGNVAGEPWPSNLIVRDVVIERVGPQGNRHGIRLSSLNRVDIERCRVEGWGGAAVEIVGCHDVTVTQSQFKGLPDHGQQCGIQMRAGSSNTRVEECRFEDAGTYAVLFGGRSQVEEFCPPISEAATNGSSFEARSANVERSLIIGASHAVGFFACSECLVRNCTIIRPRGSVLVIGHDHPDPRMGSARRSIFGANLVLWKPGDLQSLSIVDPAVNVDSFVIEPNLWWSPDVESQREKLGTLPGKAIWDQIWDLNPALDASFRPTDPGASSFGCVQ